MEGAVPEQSEISFYHDEFPSDLATQMERTYRNIFSSIEKFEADNGLKDAVCYVERRGNNAPTILVFTHQRGTIKVLNSVIHLSAVEVDTFCKAAFSLYPGIHRIMFEAISCRLTGLTLPSQQFNCIENIVISLPRSARDYVNALGNSTRNGLKRYQKKLESDCRGLHWQVYEGRDIPANHVETIIALSSARISGKHMKSSHTDEKTRQLMRLLAVAGYVMVALIDGRICGGVISTRYGNNFFMHVVAHDRAYDRYRLGKVCLFLSIQGAIAHGANEYHLLWGKYDYKFRFLGQQRDYDRVIVYRSKIHMAMSLRLMLTVAIRGYGRQLRGRLQLAGALSQTSGWRRFIGNGVP